MGNILEVLMSFLTAENMSNLLIASGAFAWLSTVLTNKSDNRWIQLFLDFVNLAGANLFKSKNDPNLP